MTKEAMTLALEALKEGDWYIGQLETIVYSSDDDGIHENRAKVQEAIKDLEEALAKQEHDLQDTRCECCGYMTYQREHMGCIRSAKQEKGEPVAWICKERGLVEIDCPAEDDYRFTFGWLPLYTTPQPTQKPLTDEEIGAILEGVNAYGTRLYTFARAIEAAHGIKE